MSLPKRRLWEFYGPLICRLLGLTLDEKELGKILKRFNFEPGDHMHGGLTQLCSVPGPVSEYVDKMLEWRFGPYQRRIEGLDQKDICGLIEREERFKDIPLQALIWFAVRNQHEEIDEIEARIFSAIHSREHKALMFHDALSRMLPGGRAEDALKELKSALLENEELQIRYKRLKHKREQLKSEIEALNGEKSSFVVALAEQRQLNERLRKDLERLGGDSALVQIESLKREKGLLAQEIKSLTQELLEEQLDRVVGKSTGPLPSSKVNIEDETLTTDSIEIEQDTYLSPVLNGRRVAFVGGLQSLIPHYQQVVECLGGTFYFHPGEPKQGNGEIESIVDKADVVFCPVNMNSHGACRRVKRICKLTGKPCCFLRSSGLGMFRRELVDFARSLN